MMTPLLLSPDPFGRDTRIAQDGGFDCQKCPIHSPTLGAAYLHWIFAHGADLEETAFYRDGPLVHNYAKTVVLGPARDVLTYLKTTIHDEPQARPPRAWPMAQSLGLERAPDLVLAQGPGLWIEDDNTEGIVIAVCPPHPMSPTA